MAFCSFSKDFGDDGYTLVENKFITKYLPMADGFCAKVYLYGLYLCRQTSSEFSLRGMAEALKTTEKSIEDAFLFWEDYDLVEILSRDPFAVSYLPVRSAIGRPKKVRYEQYADFNKELQRKMQKVGKFVTAGDYIKYMHFLEENDIQPQAFLLIAEFCINKQGESVSPSYIFNKAKKFIKNGWISYEQVEKELSSYNAHESDLKAVFTALNLFRAPDESDYALYKKWTEELGFAKDGVLTAAKKLKKGTLNGLDSLLIELAERGKLAAGEIDEYLTERETLGNLAFRIARKLGLKIGNPAPFVDEYVGVWYNYGFDESSLLDIALYLLKCGRGDFAAMHDEVSGLFAQGIVSKEGVKEYLKTKADELKLFTSVQALCGGIKKSAANLSMIKTWREWKFSDEMILEAASRAGASGSVASPIPYMNKILSEWKRNSVFKKEDIPASDSGKVASGKATGYVNAAVEAVNAKSDRERYYALRREEAQTVADRFLARANANSRFKAITTELAKMEISLAKAEVFDPKALPALTEEKAALLRERATILEGLGITEAELTPQYGCKKCSDTGFLKSGAACDCYKAGG